MRSVSFKPATSNRINGRACVARQATGQRHGAEKGTLLVAQGGSERVRGLLAQLRYIQQVLAANTQGLTREDSLVQPAPAGNCLNWVVGHMVATRNQTLRLAGQPPIWPEERAERYRRHSLPIEGPEAAVVPFDEILADFSKSQVAIVAAIETLSEEELAAKVSWFGEEVEKEIALAGLVFHEAYHLGQAGLIRRLVGKEGAVK